MMRPMSYERKKAWAGRAFISLWFIGACVFFLYPMASSFVYTFHEMIFDASGGVFTPVGLENYRQLFMSDPYVLGYLSESLGSMFSSLPLVLLFSLFSAVLLNRKFKGRGLVRSVFFFPVIITSGALVYVLQTETNALQNTRGMSVMMRNVDIGYIVTRLTNNGQIARVVMDMMDSVFVIIWKSGVQTLLFLAGLQSISPSLYEAADVEGASGWEKFWKITVPMVSPMLLVNVVYTVVDSFTDYNNSLLQYAVTCTFGKVQYTYGTTISWLYFIITFIILMTVVGILSRKVFYVND